MRAYNLDLFYIQYSQNSSTYIKNFNYFYFQDVLNNSNMTDKEAFAFLKENLSDEAKAAMDELLKQEQNM